jgi:hypothetical protein
MKKHVINRYEIADGNVIIDVAIQKVEDLYDNFDRTAAYLKKDLDQDFVDYLIDSVREIRKHPFIIRITMRQVDDSRIERLQRSIKNYFLYLKELDIRRIKKLMRRSVFLFGLGTVLIAITAFLHAKAPLSPHITRNILTEGITVAAWVLLWEAFANLILEWHPLRENIKIYKRILTSDVLFKKQE